MFNIRFGEDKIVYCRIMNGIKHEQYEKRINL